MKYKRLLIGISLLALSMGGAMLISSGTANALSGSEFQAARIIDDDIFFNSGTMNTGDIQNFLNAKVPSCDTNGTQPSGRSGYPTRADWGRANGVPPPYICLRDYNQSFGSVGADAYCGAISGGTKSAADIIFNVARACGINPQVFLVLLQKEQSLISDPWPWPIQYRSATGYGCPDTAACDSQYYGFFNQVYNAGRQFKRYTQQPQNFNYAVGRNSFIAYQANRPDCSGTNVAIQTRATAALYNYTPYQPNAAALANLYGTGDVCSAYGNRNFWRMFNDWFGPTQGDGFTLAYNESDNTQWVIYRNIRQYVPSAEVKRAWGLPDAAVPMPHDYLATIPQGPALGRLFHLIGDPTLYVADGGKKYRVTSQQMKDAWGLTGQPEAFVSLGLWNLPTYGGFLTYSVKKASNPALYAVDGVNGSNQVVLRQYSGPDVFRAWEGDNAGFTTVSDDYFNEIDNAVGSVLTGFTVKGSGLTQYHVISGQKLELSAGMAAVFNQSVQTVNDRTINRLTTSAPVSNFIRMPGNGVTIYMVDNGQKFPVSSLDVLKAWAPGGSPTVNILNDGFLNLLTTGGVLNGYEADVSGQLYLLDGRKIPIPAGLDGAYRNGSIFTASAALMNTFASAANATNFIKGTGPAIYLVDQTNLRHIDSMRAWQLWNGSRNEALTTVSEPVLSQLTKSGRLDYYFRVGTTNYVIDNGTYRTVSAGVATDWGLNDPITINSATRDRFTSGAALNQKAKVGSTHYRVKYGKTHMTPNATVAVLWGLTTSPVEVSSELIATLPASSELSIFAKSTNSNDQRIFLVDDGGTSFYHLTSLEQFLSFGYGGGDFLVAVQPADLGTPGTAKNIIKTATTNSERVIDGGQKHDFSSSVVRDRWLSGSNALTVSDTLWSYFGTGAVFNGNVKGTGPTVYTIDNGQRRWIQSQGTYQTYTAQYGAYTAVSDRLITILPTGADIP
jgi:hypothetical protein